MKLDRGTANAIKKALIYVLTAALAAVIQSSFLGTLAPFGAVPDLLLLLTLGSGYFCGSVSGAVFGILAGVFGHFAGGTGFSPIIIFYLAVGYLTGLLVESFFAGKYLVWCMYALGAALTKGAYSLVYVGIAGGGRILGALFSSALPEALGTFILGIALYVPIKKLGKIL